MALPPPCTAATAWAVAGAVALAACELACAFALEVDVTEPPAMHKLLLHTDAGLEENFNGQSGVWCRLLKENLPDALAAKPIQFLHSKSYCIIQANPAPLLDEMICNKAQRGEMLNVEARTRTIGIGVGDGTSDSASVARLQSVGELQNASFRSGQCRHTLCMSSCAFHQFLCGHVFMDLPGWDRQGERQKDLQKPLQLQHSSIVECDLTVD